MGAATNLVVEAEGMRMTKTAVGAIASAAFVGGWAGRHVTAPTVRAWHRSTAPTLMAGPLRTRVVGTGAPATVLLHGIVGCGDFYGASYDRLADGRRLVVPDLLGFGDSYLSASPAGYDLDAHLDALDEMATALKLDGPLTIAGHSMGAALALHWAARRGTQVQKVIAMSAPLYLSPAEGRSHIRGLGRLEAMMALDTPLARSSCAWMCRHRTTASWVAVAFRPELPVPLARRGVLHTWPAYLATMEHVVLHSEWQAALSTLSEARVPVLLAAGECDPVPVPGRTTQLTKQYPTVTSALHPTAGHDLPLVDPAWCVPLLAA
jgi:pimeloyl-ACP methyl ester carboxylesterase